MQSNIALGREKKPSKNTGCTDGKINQGWPRNQQKTEQQTKEVGVVTELAHHFEND